MESVIQTPADLTIPINPTVSNHTIPVFKPINIEAVNHPGNYVVINGFVKCIHCESVSDDTFLHHAPGCKWTDIVSVQYICDLQPLIVVDFLT